MVSSLNRSGSFQTRVVGNIPRIGGHLADFVASCINQVVNDRLGGRTLDYFVSDSAPVSKSAVRRFMEREGDEKWFPCAVHFIQLATKEYVVTY